MLFPIVMITAIILAASFGLHIMPIEPIHNLTPDQAVNALYICPSTNTVFDTISIALRPFMRYINMMFFFALMLLFFSWGWGLYQNLLKDKFDASVFKNPWYFTKVLFWIAVVVILFIWTPNKYRTVTLSGAEAGWVLCEENTPGAVPVKATSVKR